MKTKFYLPAITGVLLCIYGCNKGNLNESNANLDGSIVGKWQVVKVYIKQQNLRTAAAAITDITYNSSNFDATNYFQFNSDNTAAWRGDAMYSISGISKAMNGAGTVVIGVNDFKYTVSGPKVSLVTTDFFPTTANSTPAPLVETIITLDAHNLVLQTENSDDVVATTTDVYYTRVN